MKTDSRYAKKVVTVVDSPQFQDQVPDVETTLHSATGHWGQLGPLRNQSGLNETTTSALKISISPN